MIKLNSFHLKLQDLKNNHIKKINTSILIIAEIFNCIYFVLGLKGNNCNQTHKKSKN